MIDRETLVEYLESHVRLVIGITVALILLLVLALAVGVSTGASGSARRSSGSGAAAASSGKGAAKGRADGESVMRPVAPESLWIPSEPLTVPGVLLSRESRERWFADEAKEWYTVPDDGSLSGLAAVSARKIDEILESVP